MEYYWGHPIILLTVLASQCGRESERAVKYRVFERVSGGVNVEGWVGRKASRVSTGGQAFKCRVRENMVDLLVWENINHNVSESKIFSFFRQKLSKHTKWLNLNAPKACLYVLILFYWKNNQILNSETFILVLFHTDDCKYKQ